MLATVPTGVTTIAVGFFLAAAYLTVIGLVMLASPGAVSMSLGAPLLAGLELAGPYMFLLMGGVGDLIGLGLLRLNNWARRTAALVALVGVVMLVPSVSANAIGLQLGNLAWEGLGVVVRVMIIWYLYQAPVTEAFT
jgi:multidrug transporter EmrE-like cation transporter